jgi:hypothetical protein
MKRIATLALAFAMTMGTGSVATAAQGCGEGFHRGPHGRCLANGGATRVAVTPHGHVIGNYYNGRGYWDGHRYWQHRRHEHNGWRYY